MKTEDKYLYDIEGYAQTMGITLTDRDRIIWKTARLKGDSVKSAPVQKIEDEPIELNVNKRYATIRQICDAYPAFNVAGIRHLIFHEKTNGFASCIRRIGRKILIDQDAFEDWIHAKKEA